MKTILMALALLLIFEGIPYFIFPDDMKNLLSKIPEIESSTLRLVGLIAISLGLIMFMIIRSI